MTLWRKRLKYKMRWNDVALLYWSDVLDFFGFSHKALDITMNVLRKYSGTQVSQG